MHKSLTFRTTTKLLFSTFNDVHNHGSVQIYSLYLQAAQDCQLIYAVRKQRMVVKSIHLKNLCCPRSL